MELSSKFLKNLIGTILSDILRKKVGIDNGSVAINDFDIKDPGDGMLEINLNINAVVSKADLLSIVKKHVSDIFKGGKK